MVKVRLKLLGLGILGLGFAALIAIAPLLPLQAGVGRAPRPPSSKLGQSAVPPSESRGYQLVTYFSSVLQMPRAYGLVLPPGYAQHPTQRYPVIFLLHGGHGTATDWFTKGTALPVIQQLYANHRLPPAIIITPDGNDKRGSSAFWDPQYLNGPHGRVLTAIGDELVHVVRSRYRTQAEAKFWAIGGLSSGGWGALNIGLHRYNHFSILFSHSGYFLDKSGAGNSPLLYVQRLSPAHRRQLHIYLDAGEGDGRFLVQSRQFYQQLRLLGVASVFHEFPGGHGLRGADVGWHYWHRHLADSLSYVGERFRQAGAQTSIQ